MTLRLMNMSSIKIKQFIFLQLLLILFISAVSCNSKKEEEETEIAVTPALVAIKQFYLKANDSVLKHLDSVAFSIDLNTGVIFNADSLPKGTNVTRLIPSITFANTMTKAEISFLKDNEEEVTVDYLKNPEDSIDFTYPVKLDVTAQDGLNNFTYQIRVNVHTQEPDTLIWDKLATSPLPSRYQNPVAQKTIYRNETTYTLVEEYNGEYTLSRCPDLNEGIWETQALNLGFVPDLVSFTSSAEKLWILSDEGNLFSSIDGLSWTATEQNWISIIGAYDNGILGIKQEDETLLHTQYPMSEGFHESPVEENFPIYNSSALGVIQTEWASTPFAILACGTDEEGNISNAVWAYDGETWAIINDDTLPPLEKPMMARYVVYRDTPYIFTQREMDVWLLFGGVREDEEMNRSVYMSYDNGVHWTLAPEMMQFPDSMPSLGGADVIVAGYILSADLSEAWTPKESTRTYPWTRTSYTIDGFEIRWICPYLYIFGGYPDNVTLSTEIWRGVIARLEFTPII